MSMPTLFMMCSLPGSGKSTFAKALSEGTGAEIFSSDALRVELFNDVNDREHNGELFQELHRRIKDCLKSGKSAIYDATNLSSKQRRAFLQSLNNTKCFKQCVIMATPYEQCLENNAKRERNVPLDVIDRMYRHFNVPGMFEGWDSIDVVYWDGSENSKDIAAWIGGNLDFDQHSSYHTMTLGEHCMAVGESLKDKDELLAVAGFIHDCGKPYTGKFKNSKGEPTETMHFYGHENVGAYEALFFDCVGFDPLEVSLLVNLHMVPYNYERGGLNEKLRNKYKRLWGEELFEKIELLHEADKSAH